VLFLRKRDPDQPFWHWALQHQADVPVAPCELVRDRQIVCDRAEAEQVLTFLREQGYSDDGPRHARTPVELIDADGQPVALRLRGLG
jgi:hypothetical protein